MREWFVGSDGTMLPWMNGAQFGSFVVFVSAVVVFVWFRWVATEDRIRRSTPLLDPFGHLRRGSEDVAGWRRLHRWWANSQIESSASYSRMLRRISPFIAAGAAAYFVAASLARL